LRSRANRAQSRVEVRTPSSAGRALEFPRDHGSHPDFAPNVVRPQWVADAAGNARRAGHFSGSPASPTRIARSRAAPLVFAHAALADPRGRLLHDRARGARGLRSAGADETTPTRAGSAMAWLALIDGARSGAHRRARVTLTLRFADAADPAQGVRGFRQGTRAGAGELLLQ
jgi:hypothetical protein